MAERLVLGQDEGFCARRAVDALARGRDGHEAIAQLLALDRQADFLQGFFCLQQLVQANGVEAIFFERVLRLLPAARQLVHLGGESAGVGAGLTACVLEVKVQQVLIAQEHLVVESFLRKSVDALVGDDRVLATLAVVVEVADGGLAVEIAPPLDDVGRMIDVLASQVSLVSELLESLEVVVLVAQPVGVHLPEHPLRSHLEESAASPAVAHLVGHVLQLEAVAQLMGHAVHRAILDAVGSHPQGADEIVVGAAIGSAVERVVHHDHHLIALGI